MGINCEALRTLRGRADAMIKVLDLAILNATPLRYSRSTVEKQIDSFDHYRFREITGLCDNNLGPLLDNQVKKAIHADRPDVAIDMLIPILHFFNQYQDSLDDSCGTSGMFLDDWCDMLEAAFDKGGKCCSEPVLRELLETVRSFTCYSHDKLSKIEDDLEELLKKKYSYSERKKKNRKRNLSPRERITECAKVPLPAIAGRAKVADMIASTEILFDADPVETVVVDDQQWVTDYYELPDEDEDPSTLSPQLLRIELDTSVMESQNIRMDEIVQIILAHFGDTLNVITSDPSDKSRNILRIRLFKDDFLQERDGDAEAIQLLKNIVDTLTGKSTHVESLTRTDGVSVEGSLEDATRNAAEHPETADNRPEKACKVRKIL